MCVCARTYIHRLSVLLTAQVTWNRTTADTKGCFQPVMVPRPLVCVCGRDGIFGTTDGIFGCVLEHSPLIHPVCMRQTDPGPVLTYTIINVQIHL